MATKKNIKHYRGDTLDAILEIEGFTPQTGDVVKFGIKEDFDDATYLVQKTVDPTTMRLHLSSSETQNLPVKCVYDAQITYTDDDGVSYTETFIYGNMKVTKDVVR